MTWVQLKNRFKSVGKCDRCGKFIHVKIIDVIGSKKSHVTYPDVQLTNELDERTDMLCSRCFGFIKDELV